MILYKLFKCDNFTAFDHHVLFDIMLQRGVKAVRLKLIRFKVVLVKCVSLDYHMFTACYTTVGDKCNFVQEGTTPVVRYGCSFSGNGTHL